MRKLFVVLIVSALLLAFAAPSFAQDEAGSLPACTEEELADTVEQLTVIDDSFQELVTGLDPTSPDYAAGVVALDGIAVSLWTIVYPEAPMCLEVQTLIYFKSYQYDEQVTVSLLTSLAAALGSAGDTETAEALSETIAARLEVIMGEVEIFGDLSLEDLAFSLVDTGLEPCAEEDMMAAVETMGAAMASFQEETSSSEDQFSTFMITEDLTFTFWNEGYFDLAICVESEALATQLGTFLSISNVIAGLYTNAAVQAELGNAEVAEALTTSAQTREGVIGMMMGMGE